MFIDRGEELVFLNSLLTRRHPGPAQLVMLYGRRRVGKTALLRHWLAESGVEHTYWVAEKETAPLQRLKLMANLLRVSPPQAPHFESWSSLWGAVAELTRGRRHVLVLDELPYAAEADSAMLSSLQNAWDHHFKESSLVIVLCGSHVRAMGTLLAYQSPLFGRMTGQWELRPLPFSSLAKFFPKWSASERVTAYAVVGGIPAYLEWLDPARSMMDNIRQVVLAHGGMFLAEPAFLLYDEVTEPRTYLAIIKAIGAGAHAYNDVCKGSLVEKSNLSGYLAPLQDLRLVERRVPATIPPLQRLMSRRGRYHLRDPYFRFYFRFLAQGADAAIFQTDLILRDIEQGLQAFVGQTAFEELARHWVLAQSTRGQLPFMPDTIGSHWGPGAQVDVAAVDWSRRYILLGECTWSRSPMPAATVEALIKQKTPKVLAELSGDPSEWSVVYVFFARAGFTSGAQKAAAPAAATLVDLATLDADIGADG